MRVLVLGSTGASGRRIVERALADGHHVTAFARDVGRVAMEHPLLARAAGDVTVASTLAAAVPGHDAVVWAVGGHDRLRDPLRQSRHAGVCAVGTANLLAVMAGTSARRLICQSSWGVGDGRTRAPILYRRLVFPLLLADELADKAEQERLIRASDLQWTIVRPARLTDTPGTGRYRAAPQLRFSSRAHVARADVAELIVREIERPRFARQTVEMSA